ncbi:pantoate--beta-alanine ligase [candidate division WOR-3 bacterium]|nr:pantoate--beta-alanine ligase [candidate division WOR-3 bacterium]
MEIITTVKNMQTLSGKLHKNRYIGFVPTMGFLHRGHLSLVDRARSMSDIVVVSIFVNPKQFGPSEDIKSYPRDFKHDRRLLEETECDILFYPDVEDLYPQGYSTYVEVEGFDTTLCGARRHRHMRGVATVCTKLFNIVRPQLAVFGEKDYQQVIMIKKMVSDMNLNVEIVTSHTVREDDGLAVSSRNIYLNNGERKDAPVLYKALLIGKRMIETGENDTGNVLEAIREVIEEKKSSRIEYIEIVDKESLKILKRIDRPAVIALAVYFGTTRLIDNILTVPGGISKECSGKC